MRKIKIYILFAFTIGILVGCNDSLSINNNSNDVLLTADLYNIIIAEGDPQTYELSYSLEEVIEILLEKMASVGMLSEPESIGFLMDELLYTINDAGYFYCIQTYDSTHASSRQYISKTQTFYVNGYSGDVYQVEIGSDAKTCFTKLE